MKSQRIFDQLGQVSLRYIDEAAPIHPAPHRRIWPKWAAAAACLALAGVLVYRVEYPYPVRQAEGTTVSELAVVPHWEDMEIYQQYAEVRRAGISYSVHAAQIPDEQLGASLGEAEGYGRDEYADDGLRTCTVALREIAGIAPACAAAVQYSEGGAYYAAVNSYYRPETLGQFIADLDLRRILETNGASYDWTSPLAGRSAVIRYDQVDDAQLWTLLETGLDSPNTWDDQTPLAPPCLTISINLPLLGYENISLTLHTDATVTTNILDTGKQFRLDPEAMQAFLQHLRRTGAGYEVVLPPGAEILE